jgi:YfiH family protein
MQYITPDWPAPPNIHAFTTTRNNGTSSSSYSSFNLADHVGDNLEFVTQNRQLLAESLRLPSEPLWLDQHHSNIVLESNDSFCHNLKADAIVTRKSNTVCVVLTADCLPILLCNLNGTLVSAIHAGWRGLADDIILQTVNKLEEDHAQLLVWLGPAIGPNAFEVSDDVRDAFISKNKNYAPGFKPTTNSKWLANIYQLATIQLNNLGIHAIYGGEYCTYNNAENFYSYRRDKGLTGRMASLIWLS